MMFDGSYCGTAPALGDVLARWNFEPFVLTALGAAAILSWRRASRGGGIATALLALAFVSPICAASVALFSARSLHHLVLLAAAGAGALALSPSLVGRLRLPVLPTLVLMTAVLWAWHLPQLYDLALRNMAVYWAMQLSLLASIAMFWIAIRAAGPVAAASGLVGGAVQMGFLGAVLTFAQQPFYEIHRLAAPTWGLSPLADQQLAGLVMWVGGMAPFAIAGGLIAHRAWIGLDAPAGGRAA
ncbi:cytochrome c oxidase assembly protein [Fulvimarina endophytica]|uniref:Cytochrome c oxidase assembly protein n=1 Tax=Fulvimarina endophytica TaxID=2293836 RepID=A0A371X7U5_9HYPH|nr:cytochrome c oxidase assembly protein [Fulvimarina endophytica]RFC65287.1 cytochrome c oxidase assembly protein [Fulvimarina endophytica]